MVEREKREDWGAERGYRDREKRDKLTRGGYHRHLPLLLFPQDTAFLLSSRLDSAVKCCSSEVLKFSFQRSCSVKGLARRN